MKIKLFLLLVVCALVTVKVERSIADDHKEPLVKITELVTLAGGDLPGDPKSVQALQDLKDLGLEEHVVPQLSERALDLESIRRQQAAARVLQRGGYPETIDVLGHCLSVNRYTPGGQETKAAYWQLKRELLKAIYELAERPCPVADTDSGAALDEIIPPTLRYVSSLKSAKARQISLPKDDPRSDVQIRLHVDKQVWLLGEPVLLHYEAKNLGSEQVNVSFGGDSRTWPARSLRFKIIAIDEAGNVIDDPCPSRHCHGGFGGGAKIEPGQSHWEPIPLWRSCSILRPGVYTIRVYHDLGWDGNNYFSRIESTHLPLIPHFAPVVETTLTFREPTPEEAREVVEHVLSMPRHPDRASGERAKPYGDMTTITHPVYLPILREYVDQGNHHCITAIGAMPFPEATEALLELTSHDEQEVRQLALEQLINRLPNADRWFKNRRWLAKQSWSDELKKSAMTLGWKLLERPDDVARREIIRSKGTKILAACGETADTTRYLEVFNEIIASGDKSGVHSELLKANFLLHDREAISPTPAYLPAEGLMMLKAMKQDVTFRPDGWEEVIDSLLKHSNFFVQNNALLTLPHFMADRFQEQIIAMLSSRSRAVRLAACSQAGYLRIPTATEPLLDLLRTDTDFFVIGASYHAAAKCGVTLDRLTEICIERMDEPNQKNTSFPNGRRYTFFRLLIKVLDYQGGSSASHVDWSVARKLKPRWQELLKSNRERIKAGERLEIGKPPVTHELFPRGFQVGLKGGGSWPDWSKIEEKPKKNPPAKPQDATDDFGEDSVIWQRLDRLAREGKSNAKIDVQLGDNNQIDLSTVNSTPWRDAIRQATQRRVGSPITLMRVMLEGVDAGSDSSGKIQLISIKLNNLDHFPQGGGGMYRETLPGGFVIVEHINSTLRNDNRDPVTIASFTHNHTKLWVPVPPSGQLGILGDVILSRPETASLGRIVVTVRRDTQQQIKLRRCQVGTIAVGGRYGQSFEFDPDGVCTIDQLAPGTYRLLLPDFDIRKSRWEVTVKPSTTTQLTFTAQSQTEVMLDDTSHDSKPFVSRSQFNEE